MGNDNTDIQDKTFTQDDMNALAGKIRAEEKAKYGDYEVLKEKASKLDEIEEANKTELQKANDKANELQARIDAMEKANNLSAMRSKIAEEMKVPTSLLTGEDEDSCKAQAQAILDFAGMKKTVVPDSGEPHPSGGTKSTRDQFAEAFAEAFGQD